MLSSGLIDKYVPQKIGIDTNWAKCSAGINSTLALKTTGELKSWGNNLSGTLGNGTLTSSSAPVNVFCLAVSIDEIQNDFSIYPNPVNDYIQIENSKNVKIDRICVIDYMGKTIAEKQNEFDSYTCSNLKSGIYYMLIYTAGEIHSYKFLKN